MHKFKVALILLALSTGLFITPRFANAYTVDGYLDDWGVTPFTDWAPNSPTAEYKVEDNFTHPWYAVDTNAGQPYSIDYHEYRDLEAIYFDNDGQYLYWAVVSSNPYNYDPVANPYVTDMAMAINPSPATVQTYYYPPYNNTTERVTYYNYGWNVGYIDPRTDSGPPIQKDVYGNTTWESTVASFGVGWYKITSGDLLGQYDIFNRYLGDIEPHVDQPFGPQYWTPSTYVLEGRISRSLFGGLSEGDDIYLWFTKIECMTDYITVHGDIDQANGVIPEPATMALFAIGLGGMVVRKRLKLNRITNERG